MAQHFLLSKTAKTLSLAQVFRMIDAEAETAFKMIRWADTNGAPVCPSCRSVEAYEEWRAPAKASSGPGCPHWCAGQSNGPSVRGHAEAGGGCVSGGPETQANNTTHCHCSQDAH